MTTRIITKHTINGKKEEGSNNKDMGYNHITLCQHLPYLCTSWTEQPPTHLPLLSPWHGSWREGGCSTWLLYTLTTQTSHLFFLAFLVSGVLSTGCLFGGFSAESAEAWGFGVISSRRKSSFVKCALRKKKTLNEQISSNTKTVKKYKITWNQQKQAAYFPNNSTRHW